MNLPATLDLRVGEHLRAHNHYLKEIADGSPSSGHEWTGSIAGVLNRILN